MADSNWKTRIGVEINYSSGQSSDEDDIDNTSSAERKWKGLDDIAAEYDYLGSTPPRTRIRNKERHKSNSGEGYPGSPKVVKVVRRKTMDNIVLSDMKPPEDLTEKKTKRKLLKFLRGADRDFKLNIGKCRSCRTESMPAQAAKIIIPTLVESCNRFMSLCSKPVCPVSKGSSVVSDTSKSSEDQVEDSSLCQEPKVPDNRFIFHSTFSMLIRMGNADKHCKRAISVEEHTWQNELKDLVWLEVCAKRAGRSTTQQDAFLCSRRDSVPALLQTVMDYRFENSVVKCSRAAIWTTQFSVRSADSGLGNSSPSDGEITPMDGSHATASMPAANPLDTITEHLCVQNNDLIHSECLCVECPTCSKAVGTAMRQVVTLLDAISDAEALYPSCKAMALHHPIVTSEEYINKIKALCLWYNMVHHQRLKLLIIRQLLFTEKWKDKTKNNMACSEKESGLQENGTNNHSHKSKVKFTIEKPKAAENGSSIELDIAKRKISGESHTETEEADQSDDDNDVRQGTPIVQIEITRIQSTDMNILESVDEVDKCINTSNGLSEQDVAKKDGVMEGNTGDQSRSPYESAESSSGSVNSNESGFGSSVNDAQDEGISQMINKFNVFELGNLKGLTRLRLYQPNQTSPYRDHIEKMLKSRGIRSALYFLEKLHLGVLKKTRMTLEKYEDIKTDDPEPNNEESKEIGSPAVEDSDEENNSDDDFEYERHTRSDVDIKELKKEYLDLRRFGAWSKEAVDMRLPSYRGIFLFLSTLPMENIHEFLIMKLETKPEKPSLLSLKQLINELREGLTIAVRMRSRFVRHTSTALNVEPENSKCWKFHYKVLETFDKTVDEVYKLYLSYLSDWAGIEYLPRATLTAEWAFNGFLARSLRSAAILAPLTFCCLTVRQLDSAAARLKKRATELGQTADSLSEKTVEECDSCDTIKWRILRVCREMQCLLTEERERALSTAQFARTVSAHLHHNFIFRNYRQRMFTATASVQSVLCWTIGRMQETASPQRLGGLDEQDRPSVQSRTREIVSQAYKFGFEFHKEMCRLINDNLSPENIYNPCARNSLTHGRRPKLIRSESINENHPSLEENCYTYNPFTPTVTTGEFTFPTINSKIRGPLSEEDESLYKNASKYPWIIRSRKFPSFYSIVSGTSLADLNPDDFKGGIPGCEECCKLSSDGKGRVSCVGDECKDMPSCDWSMTVSRGLVQFAKQWMNFAMERCERGRGLRPRWASNGLEFLMLTCDPRHTKHLTNDEFEELKTMMDGCISHVIGSSRSAGTAAMSTPLTLGTPTLQRSRSSIVFPQLSLNKSVQSATPPMSTSEPDFTSTPPPDETVRQGKQMAALYELDCRRDDLLRKASTIGSVRRGDGSREHFRPRPVTFKWQRGIKIGQGRFGKVYTVVNTETGQLLAMKEVSLGIGDRRAVERAANELKVLEGVVHPNLVRYYGVEIHREEMLIFMELCVEGSLESLIARCGAKAGLGEEGLPEQQVRRYTRQLVAAVRALHNRSIAHRDIKSGNIFLTEEGNRLKLGDFGCAVKIRANTTVPGELQGYIGTQAYMAPEVFMKSSGHGRGADIWSLGCVVVEMSSGKRPWSEYDSNYQIMFVVGMGQRPEPPPHLSTEGEDFCLACLQHDPAQRADIDTLTHHPFIQGAQ